MSDRHGYVACASHHQSALTNGCNSNFEEKSRHNVFHKHSHESLSGSTSRGKGRSRAKSLIVPKRSPRLYHTDTSVIIHNDPKDTDIIASGDQAEQYASQNTSHPSEQNEESAKVQSLPHRIVSVNAGSCSSNTTAQSIARGVVTKCESCVEVDPTSSAVTCGSSAPLLYYNSILTRSRARSYSIPSICVSPIKAKLKTLASENKCESSTIDDSRNHISPMHIPDVLSPSSSSKVDISIECRTRKSLHDLDFKNVIADGSHGKIEPEVLTSNNVVVALRFSGDDEQVTGLCNGVCHHELSRSSPSEEDHVACITIERGAQLEEQTRVPVDTSVHPDLFI